MSTLYNSIKKLWAKDSFQGSAPETIQFGSLRRLTPLCREFGYTREGGPIDRYYIEKFLTRCQGDIKGRALEIKSNGYTVQFGGSRITKSDILDINPENPRATIVADLTKADQIPSNTYDCMLLTQVLQLIYDYKAALETIHRILKPGGVLLLTVPGITQIAYEMLGKTWYWSFSEASVKKMLGEIFGDGNVTVTIHGNVLAATAFLYGLGAKELKEEEFESTDPDYQVIITARAVKGS